jgi:hypothetical protein
MCKLHICPVEFRVPQFHTLIADIHCMRIADRVAITDAPLILSAYSHPGVLFSAAFKSPVNRPILSGGCPRLCAGRLGQTGAGPVFGANRTAKGGLSWSSASGFVVFGVSMIGVNN